MADVVSPLTTRSQVSPSARAIFRALGLAAATTRILVEDRVDAGTTATNFAHRAQRTARAILAVHGCEVRCAGRKPTRPSILVANHLSYLDPLVVASVLPCIAIAKGETRKWLLIGAGLKGLGVVFVKRGDAHSGAVVLRRVWRALEQGAMVLNFPEGDYERRQRDIVFSPGIFGLKHLAGADVVPVRLAYDDDRVPWYGGATFMPHYWKLAGVPKVVARVRFGEPLQSHPSDGAADIARRARDAVSALPPA